MTNKTINCQHRNDELLDLYTKALNFMLDFQVPDAHAAAVKWAVENGRPHYHLSYERAYTIMKRLVYHNICDVGSTNSRLLWMEMGEKVKEVMACKKGISLAKALDFVLSNCRASRFFMSMSQAEKCIRQGKRLRVKRIMQHINHHHA